MNTVECLVPYNPLAKRIAPANLDLSTLTSIDVDDIGLIARRVVTVIEPEQENAVQFVKDCVWDKAPDNFPAWDMIEELFPKIRALPGSAHAFRYLLKNAEGFRQETREWWRVLCAGPDILEIKVYGMCAFLAKNAIAELDGYELKVEGAYRPADTYRAYGLALRYATEALGSFAAREALARLMMASPLPVDEMENPDWIDPYTSELDGDYTYLKVREAGDVSSDGNLPAMIQDLLDNMGEDDAAAFQAMLAARGSSLDEYWLQFKEAQRSGYVNLPEPEDEWEEPEFDVIEKDFQFAEDLKTTEAADKLRDELKEELAYMKDVVQSTAEYSQANLKTFAAAAEERITGELEAQKKAVYLGAVKARAWEEAWQKVHEHFLADKRTVWFFKCIQRAAMHYSTPDLMSVIIPLQNSFGIWEDDLYQIKLPRGRITLAHWYAIFGEDYLEGMVNRDDVDYGDPQVNKLVGRRFIPQGEPTLAELDEFVWRTVWMQQVLYQESEKRREEWARAKGWRYKQDAKWHPAFVSAEVQTAILGDGGNQSAQAAGWDAWRQAIDPDANAVYKFERRHGARYAAAMAKFWEVVKANKNRIASINQKGLKLCSGREVDWGIAVLKVKANEIPLDYNDRLRLRNLLQDKGWAPQLVKLLTDWLVEHDKKFIFTSNGPHPSDVIN